MEKIKWAPIIPLIGGFPLGTEKAIGHPPEFIGSYDGFWANDSHYVNYQNNVLNKNLEYRKIDENQTKQKLNLVVGTPPCAALSSLNTGKTPEAKGASCQKNEWMYKVFEDSFRLYDVDVVVIENAPALFSGKGKDVADKLFDICKQNGYSLTLYKTSTIFHGLPQKRNRAFAFGWKTKTAPVMNWYKRDYVSFSEYLDQIEDHELHQDEIINPKIMNEPYYKFIQSRTNEDVRNLLIEKDIKTTFKYVMQNYDLDDAINWFHEVDHKLGIKLAEHAKKKFADGKGIWDGSMHIFSDHMNAVIGRNMVDTVHPKYDRSLTIREALYMMGFPKDFELIGSQSNRIGHIAQNVPLNTAHDMTLEVIKYLRGELEQSGTTFLRQNNHNETIEYDPLGEEQSSLEAFF